MDCSLEEYQYDTISYKILDKAIIKCFDEVRPLKDTIPEVMRELIVKEFINEIKELRHYYIN